jgi:hypothetical protein
MATTGHVCSRQQRWSGIVFVFWLTSQGSLEEFIATAQLAGTEFTAEKLNVQMIVEEQNEAILTEDKKAYEHV